MPNTAESFVKKARELPVMPPVAAEIIRKAENPDTEVSALIQLISRDAALAIRVLKIANSSFYSAARKIDTLQQARRGGSPEASPERIRFPADAVIQFLTTQRYRF